MPEIAFASADLPATGALVLLLTETSAAAGLGAGAGLAAQADAACGGALTRAMAAAGFTGKKGQSCTVLAPNETLSRIVLIGLGKDADHTPRGMEEAAGHAVTALARDPAAAIAADGMPPAHAAHAALGAMLRTYRFDRYRTKEAADDKPKLQTLTMLTDDPAAAEAAWAPLHATAHGVILSRDLASEPPNVLTPTELAERCRPLADLGVEVEVLGPAELERIGMRALLAVAMGSAQEARVVTLRWKGGQDGVKPVCFVGKGVTFDTGGISIKPAPGMEDMKWDMAGAAATIGTIAALAGRKARCNAVGVVGLVENMPSGTAQRPGDVVRSLSGQTIEVQNTDAEGRLVLADLLWHAQDAFDPAITVDMATLTGAIIVALGHEHAGMFCNDDTLADRLLAAGKATGEAVWRMPLGEAYDKLIRSDIADMKNIGGRPGGAIIGAQFVQRFVRGPWAHLDIAGTAWATKDSATTPKGATAFGVRLLDRLVADNYEA
ncbi:MAG TPA: leucyl aminopeptidase [Acetobacteraceae bacterium]